jgi:hypothetical protein
MAKYALAVALIGLVTAAPLYAEEPRAAAEPFAYDLARRGTATVEDAYRVFVVMAAEQGRLTLDPNTDTERMTFNELAEQLRSLCVIDAKWTYPADCCLRRDVLAYMCASYLGCRPGIVTGVFGMTRRYAHREMLYRQIIAPGAPGTLVSGSELLSVSARVARRANPRPDVALRPDEIH